MALNIMRKTFKKLKPRIMNYSSFKHFSNEDLKEPLIDRLSVFLIDCLYNQIYINNDDGFNRICKISIDTLTTFDSIKKKIVRASQINAFYDEKILK